jgi:hypothetical protein
LEIGKFDPDQPRDERGRWSTEGGGLSKDIRTERSKLKDKSVEEINQSVRKDYENIASIAQSWQNSATSTLSSTLKFKVNKMEGIDNTNRVPIRLIRSAYYGPLIDAKVEEEKQTYKLFVKIAAEAAKEARAIQPKGEEPFVFRNPFYFTMQENGALYPPKIKVDLGLGRLESYQFSSTPHFQNLMKIFAGKILHNEESAKIIDKYINEKVSDKDYAVIRAAGKSIMEKEKYPDKFDLYRGVTLATSPKDVVDLVRAIATGKETITIPADSIVSYTPYPGVAHKFVKDGFGVVYKKEVNKEDVLIPSSLIRYRFGEEKEHIVINRDPTIKVPLKDVSLPSVETLKLQLNTESATPEQHREFEVYRDTYDRRRSELPDANIRRKLSEPPSIHNDKGIRFHVTDVGSTYHPDGTADLKKFDPDQPRDEAGRWSSTGGASGKIDAPVRVDKLNAVRKAYIKAGGSSKELNKIEANFDKIVKDAIVKIRIEPSDLRKVLSDGEFKSQHETGDSRGSYAPMARLAQEKVMFGTEKYKDEHPIYGFLHNDETVEKDDARYYGKCVVTLKDDVKPRTTFTPGDSLGSTIDSKGEHIPVHYPSGLTDAHPATMLDNVSGKLYGIGKSNQMSELGKFLKDTDIKPVRDLQVDRMFQGKIPTISYIETQVHGGVTPKDIKSVGITQILYPNTLLVEELRDRKIPVLFGGDEGAVSPLRMKNSCFNYVKTNLVEEATYKKHLERHLEAAPAKLARYDKAQAALTRHKDKLMGETRKFLSSGENVPDELGRRIGKYGDRGYTLNNKQTAIRNFSENADRMLTVLNK